ncbi:hypothetical protein MB901379_03575 [Mycobacterium basiliense]|uniref:DUF2510 domain-containing protein n=1 Tax=Mycobacterium basiliense TaxID=2094119 RepID=A0A447GHQ3_9MYCO|nr:DUF2510 domain-containing protein [Mycobacterium basiliense]VDM89984.1 hypothetical protein MB901379_03575 [Mycobacterium basiliense]
MTQSIPPGWYPESPGATMVRYWNGQGWTVHRAPAPVYRDSDLDLARRLGGLISAHPGKAVFVLFFVPFAFWIGVAGGWQALLGLAFLVALVGVPAGLIMLAVRQTRQHREYRARVRRYEAGLAARADREHQAMLRGDLDAGVFGAFQPELSGQPPQLPDAEQMRQSAWQPDLPDQQPVRPDNPAPWHVVTQWPTRQFQIGGS